MLGKERGMSLWMLAWPVFLEMFLQFLLGTADTLMVSHISDDAVAVIGISSQLFAAVNILFMAVASGAGILVAQRLGAKKEAEGRLIGIIGAKLCLGLGALLSVLLYFGAGPIVRMLQLPTELQPLGETYISIVGGGMIFMAAMAGLGTVIRNTGNTRSPMYIAIGMNIIHIGMNYVVIYGAFGIPPLGLEGVAWSTTISRLAGAATMIAVFCSCFQQRIEWKDFRLFNRPLFKETLKISWPLGISMSSWCFTQLVIFALIAMIGSKELSARTYMNTMESFCFLIGFSIALAGQIRIAHLYGSGEHQAAYRCAYQVIWVGLVLVQANALLLYWFGEEAIRFFTNDPEIIMFGVSLLAINLLLQPAKMVNMAIVNALTAVGDTRYVMIVGFIVMWLVAVGGSYYMGIRLGWGLHGIYAAMIADELLRGLLVLVRWRAKRFMIKSTADVQTNKAVVIQ
ncbi:MATE family efflux transporter [Paenibacillus radicis (ex Xue et al. 2023)]|uniref:MATE family efflux transporter n=1 Tax=Paenibacillus radicis (ex Xue et al. 2023) TaxID=2972489 RepID=A0ABT1YT06_9BACL|nr:MATE family efflux transporter [Paenibacillus radicis (ex Xue et al. 2023)]MCR8635428.1 MATE family efflux transporter [Paenibacillus radicis (ex Xue et al. 2023)]